MKRTLYVVFATVLLCLPAAAVGARADLSGIDSWAIWLQEPDIDTLVDCTYDAVVIDYSYDGSEDGEFSYADIERVRDSGKTVLAYFSIGEASDFRFYWKSNWRVGKPGFIGPENPNWPGAYRVKYWTSGWWKKALRPWLDRVLAAGFDGVWLDGIDSYWYWYEQGYDPVRAANRMAKLVRKVAQYAREQAGEDFIVCPNNGVSMLDDASSRWSGRYLADVDAVSVESLFYDYWSLEDQEYRLEKLAQFDDAGKRIFSIEYIEETDWDDYFAAIDDSGLDMLGYPADPDRELDELIIVN
jgi:cysteinyl-tRNA synthetase